MSAAEDDLRQLRALAQSAAIAADSTSAGQHDAHYREVCRKCATDEAYREDYAKAVTLLLPFYSAVKR